MEKFAVHISPSPCWTLKPQWGEGKSQAKLTARKHQPPQVTHTQHDFCKSQAALSSVAFFLVGSAPPLRGEKPTGAKPSCVWRTHSWAALPSPHLPPAKNASHQKNPGYGPTCWSAWQLFKGAFLGNQSQTWSYLNPCFCSLLLFAGVRKQQLNCSQPFKPQS